MSHETIPDTTLLIRLTGLKNGLDSNVVAKNWKLLLHVGKFSTTTSAALLTIQQAQQTYYEDVILESEVQVVHSKLKTVDIKQLANLLLESWCHKTFTDVVHPRFEILTPSVWTSPFLPLHDNIRVEMFSFGVFLSWNTYGKIFAEPTNGIINATFEHDCKKLNIGYKIRAGKRLRTLEMQVEYSSICDATVDKIKDNFCLHLRLKYPPDVCMKEEGLQNAKFKRAIRREIAANNVLKLVFSILDDNIFWEILCRVKKRANIRIYFAPIESLHFEQTIPQRPLSCFSILYLVDALRSRGNVVCCQISDTFYDEVKSTSNRNILATEKALEQLILGVDEQRTISLVPALQCIFERYSELTRDDDDLPSNYTKVKKIILTPTRQILMPPEIVKSNRVLREFGEDNFLRVTIRDENGRKLITNRFNYEIESRILSFLRDGFRCGNRHYKFLGWSNSQLRDVSFYMFCSTNNGQTVEDIRRWMGDFSDIHNVAKYMSRMGQCFTQAQSTIELDRKYEINPDIRGPMKPNSQEPYIFSDGIGKISLQLAKKVCNVLHLKRTTIPSAYQIRIGGCKGMVTIDKTTTVDLVVRPSMLKFKSSSLKLEIVKFSQPSSVYLNRPFIMILDQVSTRQGVHDRVAGRIHELLANDLAALAQMFLSETECIKVLTKESTLKIDFELLSRSGISLLSDPFFRGILYAYYQTKRYGLLSKTKIEIPLNLGRTMFGVLDETGILEYGQIFVQYSENMKKPGKHIVPVTGRVMVTKNPCLVPGDVRLFEAVYHKELIHLYDVIVFPQKGPRPHPDEMAGSDLDGDEYSVIWDQQLMFNENEEAANYDKQVAPVLNQQIQDSHMTEFFVDYMANDSVGLLSIAHLILADRTDLFSEDCMNMAENCSIAVDFPKTGVPAEQLQERYRPKLYPDYMDKTDKLMYKSDRLIGSLHRKIKAISDTLENENIRSMKLKFTNSIFNELNGWKDYSHTANIEYNKYQTHIQCLLDSYGAKTESQLFCSQISSIKNRVFDNEKDAFSMYDTETIIKLRVEKITEQFRSRFFEEFGGEDYESLSPELKLKAKQKALAFYYVAYNGRENGLPNNFYSFPWMFWDVLLCNVDNIKSAATPFGNKSSISARLNTLIEEFFHSSRLDTIYSSGRVLHYIQELSDRPGLKIYCTNQAVQMVAVAIYQWLDSAYSMKEGFGIRRKYASRLFIYFLSEIKKVNTITKDNMGEMLLGFIDYVASVEFLQDRLHLTIAKLKLAPTVCQRLNELAYKTINHIAITSDFSSLNISRSITPNKIVAEFEPVRVDIWALGERINLTTDQIVGELKRKSGMDEVSMRPASKRHNERHYFVSGVGTLESRTRLMDVLVTNA